MDREAWRAEIHGVTKSWTQLSKWIDLKVKQKPWDVCGIFFIRRGDGLNQSLITECFSSQVPASRES